MRTCILLLGALVACLLISCSNAAAGGPCDSTCVDKLNCCNDQLLGRTCFNTTTQDCTANTQICAKNLFLCSTTCYDGTLYDCIGTKLCPKGLQLCGTDQCYDTTRYSCVEGTQVLRTKAAAECGGIGYNTQINECVNGTVGPIRPSTPCQPHQSLCGSYCYDPELYSCGQTGNLTSLPGVCGRGEVWCSIKCYDPLKYTCQNGNLYDWAIGDACPSGQTTCGLACYNPAADLVCSQQLVICPTGMGVCNSTCFNTTRYDCVGNQTIAHPGYCPSNMGLCGTRCYNTSNYMCARDLLVPMGDSSCGNSPCLSQDQCCSDDYNGTLCYEDTYYQCDTNSVGAKLCGKGLSLCGNECYDPSIYACNNNSVLCPSGLDYCTTNSAVGCFDKSVYQCLVSSVLCPVGGTLCGSACINIDKYICKASAILFVVCPRGQLNCAGTCYVAGGKLQCINRTLVEVDDVTCPDGNCNNTCFDTSRAYCVDGQVVPKPACDDGEDLCYTTCYNTTSQVCLEDTVYVKCDPGMDRCNQTCYDENTYDCVNGVVVAETCASKGLGDCGTACYNATTSNCKDGSIYPKCTNNTLECGVSCYDPLTQDCKGNTIVVLCTGGKSACGQKCYDPSTQSCDNGVIKDNSASLPAVSFSLIILMILCTIF